MLTAAFLTQYDTTLAHFDKGSPLLLAASVFIAFALLAPMLEGFYMKGRASLGSPLTTGTALVFASAMCGFMMTASTVLGIIEAMNADAGSPFAMAAAGVFTTETVFAILELALTFPAAIFFFAAASGMRRDSNAYALLELVPVLWAAARLLSVYFTKSLTLNSPRKTCLLMLAVALMLFFVSEARFALGRQSLSRYVFGGCALALTATLVWAPEAASAVARAELFDYRLIDSAVLAAITLYAALRMLASAKLVTRYAPPPEAEKKKPAEAK